MSNRETGVSEEESRASTTTQAQHEQEEDSLQKIEQFFEVLPPPVIKEIDLQQSESRPPAPQQSTTAAQQPLHQESQPASFQAQVITPGATPPQSLQEIGTTQGIGLNFEEADIYDVIKVVSEITGKSFIVDREVEGTVTLYSEESLTPEQVFDLFKSALELNDLAITQVGDFYKIVKSEKAQQRYLQVDTGPLQPEEDQLITHIVKLKYVSAQDVKAALEGLTPSAENIVVYPGTDDSKTLIITDLASNVRKLLEIIREIDVSQYANRYVHVFRIQHATLDELIKELHQVLALQHGQSLDEMAQEEGEGEEAEDPTARPSALVPPGTETTLMPIPRLNSLMVTTNYPEVITLVKKWIDILDKQPYMAGQMLIGSELKPYEIYHAQFSPAPDLKAMLDEYYNTVVTPAQPQEEEGQEGEEAQPPVPAPVGDDSDSKPAFIANKEENYLIIKAPSIKAYKEIKELLAQIDRRPLQVLIDVIIAEVILTDSDTFGMQGMLMSQDQLTIGSETNSVEAITETVFSGAFPSDGQGFRYAIAAPGRFLAQLRALATESRVRVLSAPHILVKNNTRATINVGDQIPIKEVTGTGEDAKETIKYQDTGIILNVTPRINQEGSVVMKISQEVSSPGTQEAGAAAPPINTRKTETNVVTDDGYPLIIGGLIKNTTSGSESGVPLLKDIPLLGRLFRYKEQSNNRTELLILVTPRVIRDFREGWAVTDNVLEKRIEQLEELFSRDASDADKIKDYLKEHFESEE